MELLPIIYHWLVRPKWFANKYINSYLNSNYCFKGKSVLEFGCGIGTNCTNFEPNNYLGVDCDLKRIDFARNRYQEYCFKSVNSSQIPVPDGLIDYIIIISVLHHISRWEVDEYLKEFQRILKPDGKVILMEPCISNEANFKSRLMCLIDRGKYIRSRKEYLNLFEKHDFKARIIDRYNQLLIYKKIIIEASLT